MGKLGGLVLIAAVALTGCAPAAAPVEAAATNRATVQPAKVTQPIRVGIYKGMPEADFADFERRLCASLAAGNTVEDTVNVQLNLFGAKAAADMRTVATSVKETVC